MCSSDLSGRSLCTQDANGRYAALQAYLQQCVNEAWRLSERLGARYFTHSGDVRQSVGV